MPAKPGIQRAAWDLRLPPPNPVNLEVPGFRPPWAGDAQGPLAPPGTYRVEMAVVSAAGVEPLGDPQTFEVRPLPTSFFPAPDYAEIASYQKQTRELMRVAMGAARELGRAEDRLPYLRKALADTPQASPELFATLDRLTEELAQIRLRLSGDRIRGRWEEPAVPSVLGRIWRAGGNWDTRQAPTATQEDNLRIATDQFAELKSDLTTMLRNTLPAFEAELEAAGAPWTPGRELPME